MTERDTQKKPTPMRSITELAEEYPGLLTWPPNENLIRTVSDETGIPYLAIDVAVKRAILVDGVKNEPEIEALVGAEAGELIDAAAMAFLKERLPEEIDKESPVAKNLASPFPAVRRMAIDEILKAHGLTYAFSLATASSTSTSPVVLEHIVKTCVDELLQNRVKGDFSCELPGYFFEAVRNKNTPHEAFVTAMTRLCDPRWQVDMMQKFVMTTVSGITKSCLASWEEAHGKPQRLVTKEPVKEVATSDATEPESSATSKPKPVRRMGAMEGKSPE